MTLTLDRVKALNLNNVTCIAQIRQGCKCAAACQCQTRMFSVDFWMWPEISQLTTGRVAENSTWPVHEHENYGHCNLSSCVEWWAGECRQIAGDNDQHRMTSTCSTVRYNAAILWRHLNTATGILNVIRCRPGSQCRLRRTGVICSYLVAPVTRQAATF